MSIESLLNYPAIAIFHTLSIQHSSFILFLAAFEDYLIGDPWTWLHPVQVMGWLIQNYTNLAIKFYQLGWQRRLAGVFLGLGLIIGSGVAGLANS